PDPGAALPAGRGRPRHRPGPGRHRPRGSLQPVRRDRHLHPDRRRATPGRRAALTVRELRTPPAMPPSDRPGFHRPAKKSLGQHFLHERGVVDRIILAVDPRPGERIVEIGPGQGAMTFPLLRRHGALTAIEFDRDLLAPLAEAARAHGDLSLVHADVLDVDLTALAAGAPMRLVGNLPYNLSSPILFHALDHAA